MMGKIIFGVAVFILVVVGVVFVGYIINSKSQFTLNVSVDNVFSIPIKTSVPIKTTVTVPVLIPVLGQKVNVEVPIDTSVPINTTIQVPIKASVPVKIKISDLLPIK